MGLVTALVVGAVVVAAGAAATAVVQKKAADKAASAQKKAVDTQSKMVNKNMDPDRLNALAKRFDESRAKRRLEFQKEIDPELAQLRELSKKQLLEGAEKPKAQREANQLASQLFKEVKDQDPRLEALKDSLISGAQKELDSGATLPPEYQAELMRAGLNKGSQAGIALDRNNIGGTQARLLGLAGVQLKEARQDQAMQMAGAAQNIVSARASILATVFPKLRDLDTVDRAETERNFALANAMVPESGLSGQDAVNISLAKTKAKMALTDRRGQIKAQEALAEGQYQGQLIGAGTSLVTGVMGAYTGGGGMGGGSQQTPPPTYQPVSGSAVGDYGGYGMSYGQQAPPQSSGYLSSSYLGSYR